MYGSIEFDDLAQLAEFLGEFTGRSTATFRVVTVRNVWILTFAGGF